jgi:outer membrane biosynthesis protein TonB
MKQHRPGFRRRGPQLVAIAALALLTLQAAEASQFKDFIKKKVEEVQEEVLEQIAEEPDEEEPAPEPAEQQTPAPQPRPTAGESQPVATEPVPSDPAGPSNGPTSQGSPEPSATPPLVAPAPAGAATAPTPESAKAPATRASGASTAASAAAAKAGLPIVGDRPLLIVERWTGVIEHGIATAADVAAMDRFLDHIRLGLNPDIARTSSAGDDRQAYVMDDRANCVANRILPPDARNGLLQPDVDPTSGDKQFRAWKGAPDIIRGAGGNEFELQRAKERFNELLPGLVAEAPHLPMKFVLVDQVLLRTYDQDQGGFPFTPPDLTLRKSACLGIDSDYLPVATKLPSLLAMSPEAGEELIQRIPVSPGSGRPERKAFIAVELTLSAAPKNPLRGKLPGETLVPMKIDIDSVALYEDPDLERQIHSFGVDAPAPAVLLSGNADSIPGPELRMLDEEAITLLLLQSQGDALSDAAWHVLARRHSYNDQLYYKKERHRWLAGSRKVAHLESFDPHYVPFFPPGKKLSHNDQLDDNQMNAFRQWSLARAQALTSGTRFELVGKLESERVRGRLTGNLRLRLGESLAEHRHVVEQLEAAGYTAARIFPVTLRDSVTGGRLDQDYLASPKGNRTVYLTLAHPLDQLVPDTSTAELKNHAPQVSGSWPVVMEVVVKDVELIAVAPDSRSYVNRAAEAFLVHLEPRSVQVLSFDATDTLFSQDYDLAALRAEEAAAVQQAADAEADARQALAEADIDGLTLSMPYSEAEAAVRKKLAIGRVRQTNSAGHPRPYFRDMTQFENVDGSERIMLFRARPDSEKLVGIARWVDLPEGTTIDDIKDQLVAKYGEPNKSHSSGLRWNANDDRRVCDSYIGIIGPPPISEGEAITRYEQYGSISISRSSQRSGQSTNDALKELRDACSAQLLATVQTSRLVLVLLDVSAYAAENVAEDQSTSVELDL